MSKVVKGIKKVGKFVKKHWKVAAGAALVAFTGGLAIGGMSAFKGMVASKGLFTTVASTMKAGITGIAGTVGIGSGASGAFAGAAGMQGATLMTGAGAQALGLASQGVGGIGVSSGVGTYAGPGSSFMGGGGSLFGGAAGQAPAQMSAATNLASNTPIADKLVAGVPTNPGAMSTVGNATNAAQTVGNALNAGNVASQGMGWKGMAAAAAVPSLINMGAGYFGARADEEYAAEERARNRYGPIDYDNGMGVYAQNWDSPYGGYVTPDGEHRGYNPAHYQPPSLLDVAPGHVRYTGAG
jgi:hypothetical protein